MEVVTAISATLIKVGKTILKILAGDKKGRKFLAYVVGIVIVIALLPLIAVYGIFSWMAGQPEKLIDYDMVYNLMPTEYQEKMTEYDSTLAEIDEVFSTKGIDEEDTLMAKSVFLTCLVDHADEESFAEAYADCFLSVGENGDLLTVISDTFGVTFTDADRESFQNLYGGTT